MNAQIDVVRASVASGIPGTAVIRRWVSAALPADNTAHEVCVRIVDEAEIRALNGRYRGKDHATNVLSFGAEIPPELNIPLLGDIVICAAVVNREAIEQHKSATAHWAHMLVHGTLHLLGHDHQTDLDASTMEALEARILASLDFPDPYLSREEESMS